MGVIPELNSADPGDGCTREQMLKVTEGMFMIEQRLITGDDFDSTIGVTGKVMIYKKMNNRISMCL